MRFWRDIQLPDQQHPKKYTFSKYIWKIIKRLHEYQYINVLLTNAIPNDIFCIFYSLYAYNVCINTLRLQKNFVEDIKYFNPHSFARFCDFRNFSLKVCKKQNRQNVSTKIIQYLRNIRPCISNGASTQPEKQ